MKREILIILALIPLVMAQDPALIIKNVICNLYKQVKPLALALAMVMGVYAVAQYAYSSDDPGGRKKAKAVILTAAVGLIIVKLAPAIVSSVSGHGVPCT